MVDVLYLCLGMAVVVLVAVALVIVVQRFQEICLYLWFQPGRVARAYRYQARHYAWSATIRAWNLR